MGSLICPKPRRPGNINTHSNCLPLRNQAEVFISKGGEELFDLIGKEGVFLNEEDCGRMTVNVASSNPADDEERE
ncbi:hypothetical protein H5410_014186 [Solanum commersonii]|uniref:Uncharacterized protein n=1 Tax=Solanum commersonii TaxID=4109 RepID=A0A9J5ZQM2_SOLCO|nr:hypothetical protein H5410_014186 [Solanum commersonii]